MGQNGLGGFLKEKDLENFKGNVVFVLVEVFYREQRNGLDKKDGMCGQEGRLYCQYFSLDKDIKIMGDIRSCFLLIFEFK